MIFPIMNFETIIRNSRDNKEMPINEVVNRAKKLDSVLGTVILMSNGELIKGFNPDLVTREAFFDLNEEKIKSFYFENWKKIPFEEPYFSKKNHVFLGNFREGFFNLENIFNDYFSLATIYRNPIFNLNGLYRENGIKNSPKYFKREEYKRILKINFLEEFLDSRDKSGFEPKDMVVKNNKLRLRLLENQYDKNSDFYAIVK